MSHPIQLVRCTLGGGSRDVQTSDYSFSTEESISGNVSSLVQTKLWQGNSPLEHSSKKLGIRIIYSSNCESQFTILTHRAIKVCDKPVRSSQGQEIWLGSFLEKQSIVGKVSALHLTQSRSKGTASRASTGFPFSVPTKAFGLISQVMETEIVESFRKCLCFKGMWPGDPGTRLGFLFLLSWIA